MHRERKSPYKRNKIRWGAKKFSRGSGKIFKVSAPGVIKSSTGPTSSQRSLSIIFSLRDKATILLSAVMAAAAARRQEPYRASLLVTATPPTAAAWWRPLAEAASLGPAAVAPGGLARFPDPTPTTRSITGNKACIYIVNRLSIRSAKLSKKHIFEMIRL